MFVVEGDTRLFERAVGRLGDLLVDWRGADVPDAIAEKWFYPLERRLFAAEGASGGEAWAPRLKPSNRPLMQLTGETLRSLTQRGAPGGVFEPGRESVMLGTRVPQAGYHMRPRGRRPARKVLQVSERDRRDLLRVVHRRYAEAVRDLVGG